jgi:hypothetical protein
MTIASPLAQVLGALGEKLVEADVRRLEIEALRWDVERERWQERVAALVVFALIGAIVGLVAVTH